MRRRFRTTFSDAQFVLLADFVGPLPRRTRSQPRAVAQPWFEQLALDLRQPPVWVDPDEIPEDGDYPAHLLVKAADLEMPKTRAPASVWDLGARCAAVSVIAEFMLATPSAQAHQESDAPTIHRRIIRDGDVTRHISMRYQETEEAIEKERARRARQKVPKPPKQSFRLGKAVA